jgi:hypothetical protein
MGSLALIFGIVGVLAAVGAAVLAGFGGIREVKEHEGVYSLPRFGGWVVVLSIAAAVASGVGLLLDHLPGL